MPEFVLCNTKCLGALISEKNTIKLGLEEQIHRGQRNLILIILQINELSL